MDPTAYYSCTGFVRTSRRIDLQHTCAVSASGQIRSRRRHDNGVSGLRSNTSMVGVTSAGVSYVPPREWYTLCVIDTAAYSGNLGKQGNAGGWISCDPSSCRRYDCLRFCCLYYSFFCRYMHPYCFVHRYFYYCLCSRASSAALHLLQRCTTINSQSRRRFPSPRVSPRLQRN